MQNLGVLPGYSWSRAAAVSADGSVVVGRLSQAPFAYPVAAFRWTAAGGMTTLGSLNGGTNSEANAVSADGSVVAGWASDGAASNQRRAFRWTQAGGMVSLGTLGGVSSSAEGISANGDVLVGDAINSSGAIRAFRWNQAGGMQDLGTLNGGAHSWAFAVSSNGAVVVGRSLDGAIGNAWRAFRWTQAEGMQSLGTLAGGTASSAYGVSADGSVVVGEANVGTAGGLVDRGFRWTQGTGMQTVEDWLRANGVAVAADVTARAMGVSGDGNVVVGTLGNGNFYIARVAVSGGGTGSSGSTTGSGATVNPYASGQNPGVGSGLIDVQEIAQTFRRTRGFFDSSVKTANTVLHGAHSRPLSRRVEADRNAFWLGGDWGRDEHGGRKGNFGFAEAGLGRNFGPIQVNASLGQTWSNIDQAQNGRAKHTGTYLFTEGLLPLGADANGGLWAVLSGIYHDGKANIRRGYVNAGFFDASTGRPDTKTYGVGARLEWDRLVASGSWSASPYLEVNRTWLRLDGYTETGGGFPATFTGRKHENSELRLGVNGEYALSASTRLVGTLEATRLLETSDSATTVSILGIPGAIGTFALPAQTYKRNWGRAGVGLDTAVGAGIASLMVNATSEGEMPSYWAAASWRMSF